MEAGSETGTDLVTTDDDDDEPVVERHSMDDIVDPLPHFAEAKSGSPVNRVLRVFDSSKSKSATVAPLGVPKRLPFAPKGRASNVAPLAVASKTSFAPKLRSRLSIRRKTVTSETKPKSPFRIAVVSSSEYEAPIRPPTSEHSSKGIASPRPVRPLPRLASALPPRLLRSKSTATSVPMITQISEPSAPHGSAALSPAIHVTSPGSSSSETPPFLTPMTSPLSSPKVSRAHSMQEKRAPQPSPLRSESGALPPAASPTGYVSPMPSPLPGPLLSAPLNANSPPHVPSPGIRSPLRHTPGPSPLGSPMRHTPGPSPLGTPSVTAPPVPPRSPNRLHDYNSF